MWPAEPELVARVLGGDGSALADLFARRMNAFAAPYAHDELLTQEPFGDLLAERDGVRPEVAFDLVPFAADLASVQAEAGRVEAALGLLVGLVLRASTTQLPALLEQRWGAIAEVAERTSKLSRSLWSQLAAWYRRSAGPSRSS